MDLFDLKKITDISFLKSILSKKYITHINDNIIDIILINHPINALYPVSSLLYFMVEEIYFFINFIILKFNKLIY